MPTYVAIDTCFQWIRTALVENESLTDFYEESPDRGRLKGNIYKGVIRRIDPKIQAAFVRYGQSKDGFLPLKDIQKSASAQAVGEGDAVLVQVLKDEVGEKGAALTTRLSLSGRALVYLLDKDGDGGVSARLGESERSRLRAVLQELKVPEGASVILRTAALSKSLPDLQADLDRLSLVEKEIRDAFARRKDPGLLWREAPPITRYLREYWQKSFDQVWVNTEEALTECRHFFLQHEPDDVDKVKLSAQGPGLFEKLGLEAALAQLETSKVTLASGANIVIERTEALVSIDVNSARSKSDEADQELKENIFRINCEAAVEVARQIRLRDLGGIIIVDFIDMPEAKHREELEALMRAHCARDKAKVKVFGLSPMGLMEINRQRLRKIPETRELPICQVCQGSGRMEAIDGQALKALRLLAVRLAEKPGQEGGVLTVPADLAASLWNDYRRDLEELEAGHQARVGLEIQPSGNRSLQFHWTHAPVWAPRKSRRKPPSAGNGMPPAIEAKPETNASPRHRNPSKRSPAIPGPNMKTAKAIPENRFAGRGSHPAKVNSEPMEKAADLKTGSNDGALPETPAKPVKARARRRKRRSRR